MCSYFWERGSAFKPHLTTAEIYKEFAIKHVLVPTFVSRGAWEFALSECISQQQLNTIELSTSKVRTEYFTAAVLLPLGMTNHIYFPDIPSISLGVCTDKSFWPKVLSCWNKGSLCIFSAHMYFFQIPSNTQGGLDREKSQGLEGIVKLFKSMTEQCNSSLYPHVPDCQIRGSFSFVSFSKMWGSERMSLFCSHFRITWEQSIFLSTEKNAASMVRIVNWVVINLIAIKMKIHYYFEDSKAFSWL